MTGYLMVRCGKCGAPNKVRSLSEPPNCVECTLAIHGDGEGMLLSSGEFGAARLEHM
jgi:hypothetical protein